MGLGKNNSSSSSSSPAVLLPHDVLVEVLARLPVKSLMRFKCASKLWYALIRHDPNFITKHFHHPSNTSTNVLLSHGFKYSLSFLSPDTLRVSVHNAPLPVQVTFPDPTHTVYLPIYGPAKGLVCLSVTWECLNSIYKGNLVIWNPSTQESKLVPILPSPAYHMTSSEFIVFGFDPTTDDCKIMRFLSLFQSPRAELYSLRSDSWRVIPTAGLRYFPKDISRESSCCAGGVVYWWAKTDDEHLPDLILSFHLADELFQEIPPPPQTPQTRSAFPYLRLDDRNGSLLLIVADNNIFDVWQKLDDNRVPKSNSSNATATAAATWTKLYRIGPHPCFFRSLGFWQDDAIVLEGSKDGSAYLASYNIKTGQLSCFRDPTSEYESLSFEILFCKESLVPLRFSVNLENGD